MKTKSLIGLDEFKQAMGKLATGVSVITTSFQNQNFGLTASSVTSLSAEPPMLLVCVHQNTDTNKAISSSGSFAVHILHEGQENFAKRFSTKMEDRFEGLELTYGKSGVPLFSNYLVQIQCTVVQKVKAGTHTIYLGEMNHVEIKDHQPLLFFNRNFGIFKPLTK